MLFFLEGTFLPSLGSRRCWTQEEELQHRRRWMQENPSSRWIPALSLITLDCSISSIFASARKWFGNFWYTENLKKFSLESAIPYIYSRVWTVFESISLITQEGPKHLDILSYPYLEEWSEGRILRPFQWNCCSAWQSWVSEMSGKRENEPRV